MSNRYPSRTTFAILAAAASLTGCQPPRQSQRAPAPETPQFVNRTAESGIDFEQRSGAEKVLDIVQTSAGGVGVLDYDGDGWLDLYFVQGQHRNGAGGGNRLYRNRGNGTYEDVTERAGVRGRGYGMGCAVGDFNADGWPDLFVCNHGTSQLFQNRGDGTFEDVTAKTAADVRGCSISAVFTDLDQDGWPDLYVARYIRLAPDSRMLCTSSGLPVSCDPQAYPAQPGVFLRNEQGRRFVDRTLPADLLNEGRGMAALAAHLNDDSRLDLFITNDTSANALFLAKPGGSFESAGALSGVAYGELGVAEANMGCDAGDFNGDGRLDLFVGVMQDRASLLFRNEGGGLFTLVTREAGLAEASSPVVTWGVGFLDFDQDGDLDLFQANGHVNTLAAEVNPTHRFLQPRQLFENDGAGRFTDASARGGPAMTTPAAGRGAAFGDLDNDGDVDIVVNNLDGPPSVLFNQAEKSGSHWLQIRLVGKHPNSSPEGTLARLSVGERTLTRHLHRGYSYASASDPRLHFGLGPATQVGPLVVTWPDGTRQEVAVPGIDRELTVRQP